MADSVTEMTWQKVAGAFAKRYEAKRGMAWHYGAHVQALDDIACWIELQGGDPFKVGATLLDNWFDTKWAMKVDYKPRFLSENLGSVYNPPAVPVDQEPNEDAINARRLQEQRERNHRALQRTLSSHSETASKPPPLEELVGKIGRKV